MTRSYGRGLERWEVAITKKLVGEFRRRSRSLEREAFDDLMQECLTHWIVARRKLDPDPGGPPVAYLTRVVHNKLLDLAREREAEKRHGDLETVSLDQPVGVTDRHKGATDDRRNGATWSGSKWAFRTVRRMG